MVNLEARVSKETLTALQTDLTVRFFMTGHYKHEKSRRSADVISWALSRAEKVSNTLLQQIGQSTTEFSIQMNIIQMSSAHPTRVYICYDLFLAECNKRLRDEIHESFIPLRPVHQIVKKGNVFHIVWKKGLEHLVAEQYTGLRKYDLSPLPLFADYKNPPHYRDGRRVEDHIRLKAGEVLKDGKIVKAEEVEHGPEQASEEVEQNSPASGDGGTEHRLADEDNANKG